MFSLFQTMSNILYKPTPTPVEANPELVRQLTSHLSKNEKLIPLNASFTGVKALKVGNNTWYLLEDLIGEGSFGYVYSTKTAIKGENDGKYYEYTIDHVVKIEKLPITDQEKTVKLKNIENEAILLKRHNVNAHASFEDGDNNYLVIDNCGQSLHDFLREGKYSFNELYQIALGICNEYLYLKKTQTIHRDLKPKNICLTKRENGTYRVIIIDFGIAYHADALKKNPNGLTGTLLYMAPELLINPPSHASDAYALSAILGEMFIGQDIFSHKKNQVLGGNKAAVTHAKYDFSLLSSKIAECDMDNACVQDFEKLLNELQDKNPDKRPSIEMITLFLSSLAARKEMMNEIATPDYQKNISVYQKIQSEVIQALQALGGKQTSFDKVVRDYVHVCLKINLPVVSHIEIARKLANKTAGVTSYTDFFPSCTDNDIKLAEEVQLKIKKLHKNLTSIFESMLSGKFDGTNSGGLKEMQLILQSKLSPLDKLENMCQIAQKKTKKKFANLFSQCCFFGKGRHPEVDKFYLTLTKIQSVSNLDQLNKIIEKIATSMRSDNKQYLHPTGPKIEWCKKIPVI